MGPDVDDLVVAFAVRDDAFAILLLNESNLLVGIFQLGLFFLRDDHVGNSDGETGLGRFGEAELFQFVQRGDRLGRSGDLVTAPDNVAQLLLSGRLIEKSKLLWPNLVKDDAACRGLDRLGLGVAVNRLLTVIGVFDPDPVVCANAAVGHGKFHLHGIGKKRERAVAIGNAARILSQVIATEGNVLRGRGDWFTARRRENVVRCEHEHARL